MSYKNTSRPIAAFSMADYESLTGHAEFGRGKDKTTRKKRGLLANVGIGLGAAGVGSGAGLAANRYLQPALKYRKAQKNFDAKGFLASKGGAKGQLSRDVEAVKGLGSRAVRTGASGLAYGKAAIENPKAAAAFLGQKARNVGTNAAMLGRDGFANASEAGKRVGSDVAKAYSKIGAGKLALGIGGAAALGAAGYGGYKLLQNRKKKKAK